MKKLLLTTACLALLTAAPAAMAQPEHHPEGGHPEGGAPHLGGGEAHPGGAPHPEARARPEPVPHAAQARPAPAFHPEAAPAHHEAHTQAVRPATPAEHAQVEHHGGPGAAHNSGPRPAAVQALRRNVQAEHHFHAGAYRAPPGYAPRHWGYGERLPGAYYVRNYWITDYLAYSLFAPPDGLVWVRVGPDALLIDQYSGEIIQVDYGIFY